MFGWGLEESMDSCCRVAALIPNSGPLRGYQARSRFISGTVVRRAISLLLKNLFSLGIEIVGRREQDNGFPLRRAATISTNAESSG